MQVCFVMEQILQWSALSFTVWMTTEDQTKAYPALGAVIFPCAGGKPVPYQQAGALWLPKPLAVDLNIFCCYPVA